MGMVANMAQAKSARNLAESIHGDPIHRKFYTELVDISKNNRGFTNMGPAAVRLNTRELLAGYSKYPWLRAVVDKSSTIASSVSWVAKNGEEDIANHPILKPIMGGNSFMPGMLVLKLIFMYLDLVGEAFAVKERDAFGVPVALWPVPAHWIDSIPLKRDENFVIQAPGMVKPVDIPRSEMIHFANPDPVNPYGRGTGQATALADELETDEFASKHLKMFFRNNARPDLLIYSDDEENPITPEAAERMETRWLEKLRGVFRAHRPFFLPGKVGVREIQSSLRDMQMLDLRKFQRDIVLNVYGFPPEALGILENSNRATIESAEYFLSKHVVMPKLNLVRDVLKKDLVPDFDDRLGLGFKSPVEEDKAHILRVMRTRPDAFTLDEWRKQAEHDPLPAGDGQKFAHGSGVVFVDTHENVNPNNPTQPDADDDQDE